MSIAGALAKAGGKLATKVGLGAAAGSAAPGLGNIAGSLAGLAMWVPDLVSLVKDIAQNGPDPEKVSAVKQVRDNMVDHLVGQGEKRDAAMAMVNEQLKPIIDQTMQPGGRGLDIALDAGGAALGFGLSRILKKGGKLGGAVKAAAEEGAEAGATAAAGDAGRGEAAAASAVREQAPEVETAAEEALEGPGAEAAEGLVPDESIAAPSTPEVPDMDQLRQMLLQARLVSPMAGSTKSPAVRRRAPTA